MKKYHGSRKQFSYVENEDFISPLEAIDKVNDDDFIDVINEIVSDRWLQKYNTDWLNKLRKEVDNQRTGFIPERKKKNLVKSILSWCEGQDITFGVGLNEGKYFRDIANDVASSLLQFPFGEIEKYEDILNEHSHKFRKRGDGIHGFHKNSTPFLNENKRLILLGYKHLVSKIEESITFVKYDRERIINAEKIGFTNTASHAQLTRVFQDAIVAFSNEKTLNEIIDRASDGKPRLAKMMKRDLGINRVDFAEEKKKVDFEKNLILFNRFLDVL
tara:strand:+ start:239 stop:1057 length:819 start_codon:yes stop_codon:yes gene_type:complete